MAKLPKFEKSSGNVFADLGLPNADELLLKAQITFEIERAMKLKKLTQAKAATLMGVAQPDLSNLGSLAISISFSAEVPVQRLSIFHSCR